MRLSEKLMKSAQQLLILTALLFATSCNNGKTLVVESYSLKPAKPVTHFIAGAGEAEITPYPGVPLGGHGPGGRIARGTWMALYARAFYFEDETGNAAEMGSCELFAVSAGLRAEVLRLINQEERLEPGEGSHSA